MHFEVQALGHVKQRTVLVIIAIACTTYVGSILVSTLVAVHVRICLTVYIAMLCMYVYYRLLII